MTALLRLLQPSDALVTVVSRGLAAKEVEPWYGTRYGMRDLSALKRQWHLATLEPGLGVPPPNRFLPRQLGLKAPKREPSIQQALEGPRKRLTAWAEYFQRLDAKNTPRNALRRHVMCKMQHDMIPLNETNCDDLPPFTTHFDRF